MAKFSDIANGTRALSAPETVEIAPGVSITVRFRALAPFETSTVLVSARADAKAGGVESPEPGEPIYEAARSIHTLAFGVVDSESDAPYFDGGAEQIRASRLLTNDVIAYLYELWEQWSESVSLQKAMLSEATFKHTMEEAAVGNARPLFRLRPGARLNFTRTMAALCVSLLKSKSPSSSGSPENHKNPAEDAPRQPE